jgi:DNA-binding LacI/PurR family transcriptional regulator
MTVMLRGSVSRIEKVPRCGFGGDEPARGFGDPVAASGITAVYESGLRVLDDVAIVSAGNVHCSDLLRSSLSTVDQDSLAIGEKVAEQLLQCIEANKLSCTERIIIPVRLVVHESSRRR